jgi:chromosome segregation ATPase
LAFYVYVQYPNLLCGYLKILELQEKEYQFLKVKNDLKETVYQMEQLKKQLEAQNSTLECIETEKLKLTQKLHENLEEIKCATEEKDGLRIVKETLKTERDQLRKSLRETEAKVSYTHSSGQQVSVVFHYCTEPFES